MFLHANANKVERFHQTMAREWAYGLAYRTHRHRRPDYEAAPFESIAALVQE